jgi:lysozyme
VELIAESEQCCLKAYLCPAKVWTIGWGETNSVRAGMVWTQQEADQRLVDELSEYAEHVIRMCTFAPDDHELAALVSLAYNIGLAAFRTSTALKQHNAGNKEAAARAILLWDKATVDGEKVVLPGLVTRRHRESALYLQVDDHVPMEAMPQAVAAETSMVKSPIAQSGAATAAAGVITVASQFSEQASTVAAQVATTAQSFGMSPAVLAGVGMLVAGGVVVYWRLRQRDEGWA